MQIAAGLVRCQSLRPARNFRAPSPPLRIQLRIRRHAHPRRLPHHRTHTRRRLRRNRRSPRPPLVRRLPVPSRIQIQAPRPAPALRRLHPRQRRKPPPAPRQSRCQRRFPLHQPRRLVRHFTQTLSSRAKRRAPLLFPPRSGGRDAQRGICFFFPFLGAQHTPGNQILFLCLTVPLSSPPLLPP